MRRSLADSLDLLTISVESGLAFDGAVQHVAENTTGPLSDEFKRTLREMQLGTSRADALRAMSERTQVKDLNYIVTALVQADKLGIPITQVLRVQAEEMRLKRTQAAEEAAAKLPVKILFPVMFCIMPAVFVVILGPAGITMVEFFTNS
jgi:tight adherence protein C